MKRESVKLAAVDGDTSLAWGLQCHGTPIQRGAMQTVRVHGPDEWDSVTVRRGVPALPDLPDSPATRVIAAVPAVRHSGGLTKCSRGTHELRDFGNLKSGIRAGCIIHRSTTSPSKETAYLTIIIISPSRGASCFDCSSLHLNEAEPKSADKIGRRAV